MKKILIFIFVFSIYTISMAGMYDWFKSKKEEEKIASMKQITVSILPQKYFVERIAGDKYKINVMLLPGASPETFEPSPKQLKEVEKSEIYFKIGFPFEKVFMEALNENKKNIKIVDTTKGVNFIKTAHMHNEDNEQIKYNEESGKDPHIWISLNEVKTQLKNIKEGLEEIDSESKEFYNDNYEKFIKEIDDIDTDIKNFFNNTDKKTFLIYHPALSYFARDYGLNQIAIEKDGKEPSPRNIKEIIDIAKKENIKKILVQKESSSHNAEAVAREIEGEVILIDILKENWIEIIKDIKKSFMGR